jgi:hypothetical protein
LILFSVMPKPTFAAVPTWEMNVAVTGNLSTINMFNGKMTAQQIFEWAFKMAVETLRKKLLDMIVDQIVNWVQGGGTPKFITDWPGFLGDAADQAGGKFLQQIGLGRFCSAFKLQLSMGFIPIPKFSDRSACTISQVGANLENFLKDFNSGGWVAWEQMVLRPENNIYGAYIMAWDQLEIEKGAAVKAAESEAQAGKGFLSVKRCIKTEQMCDEEGYCTSECTQSVITTPGAVVGDTIAKAVGSDIDYIVNAQELQAYVSAISNAILNRMFSEGLGALRTAISGGGGSSGGGGINTIPNNTSSAATCSSLLGTSVYNSCITSIQSGIDIKDFQKETMASLINQDLGYQNQLLGAKQLALIVIDQLISVLTNLSTCQASNPYYLAQIRATKTAIENDIPKVQSNIIALQLKKREVDAITDLSQIPLLFSQVIALANPPLTQSLVVSIQQEISTYQQNLIYYQQQAGQCQNSSNQNSSGGSESH